jgi:hypothetical protein
MRIRIQDRGLVETTHHVFEYCDDSTRCLVCVVETLGDEFDAFFRRSCSDC